MTHKILEIEKTNIVESNYYADREYLTNSMLGYMKKSPLHYKALIEGKYPPLESAALTFGSAYDCLLLESDKFNSLYRFIPQGMRRNTKAYNEWHEAEIKDDNISLLTNSEWIKLMDMRDALLEHKEIFSMLSIGEKQKIAVWEMNGVKCKGKFDNYIDECCIVDLKTTRDIGRDAFVSSVKYKYHYDRQASWYVDGDGKKLEFWWVVQEKEAPYIPSLYKASDETIQIGREKYTELLHKVIDFNEILARGEHFNTFSQEI